MRDPAFLIVDMRDLIRDFLAYQAQYEFYQKFPLQELIRIAICVKPDIRHDEYFWHEVENRFGDDIEKLDTDIVSFFFEHLMLSVDECIGRKTPKNIDTCEYIFKRWLSPTELILVNPDLTPNHEDGTTELNYSSV